MTERSPLEEAIVAELLRQGDESERMPYVIEEGWQDDDTVLFDGYLNVAELAKAVERLYLAPQDRFPRPDDSESVCVTYDGAQWPQRPDVSFPVAWDSRKHPDAPPPMETIREGDNWYPHDSIPEYPTSWLRRLFRKDTR